jgi:hypothetical protein
MSLARLGVPPRAMPCQRASVWASVATSSSAMRRSSSGRRAANLNGEAERERRGTSVLMIVSCDCLISAKKKGEGLPGEGPRAAPPVASAYSSVSPVPAGKKERFA